MIQLYKGDQKDFDFYYEVKSEPSTIHWEGYSQKPDREKLLQFFNELVGNRLNKHIFFIKDDDKDESYGYIQLTFVEASVIEIGYAVSERFRGKGYGQFAIESIKKEKDYLDKVLTGFVAENNIASFTCFEKNGFKKTNIYRVSYFPFFERNIKLYQYVFEREKFYTHER